MNAFFAVLGGLVALYGVTLWIEARANRQRSASPPMPRAQYRTFYIQVVRMVEDDEEEPEPWVKASDRFRLTPGSTDQEIIDNLLREV